MCRTKHLRSGQHLHVLLRAVYPSCFIVSCQIQKHLAATVVCVSVLRVAGVLHRVNLLLQNNGVNGDNVVGQLTCSAEFPYCGTHFYTYD